MPNWTCNFIKASLTGVAPVVSDKDLVEEVEQLLAFQKKLAPALAEGAVVGVMDTFVPMPEVYRKYDTTNIRPERLHIGDEIYLSQTNEDVVLTEEILADIKRCCNEQMNSYGAVGWYDWRCRYWGVKWDMCDTELLSEEVTRDEALAHPEQAYVMFQGDTPWNPPYAFVKELSRQYPALVYTLDSTDADGTHHMYRYENGRTWTLLQWEEVEEEEED